MKRWFTVYRALLSTSFKEYIRDPIPTIFTTLMPLSFLLIFGITSSFVGSKSNFVLNIKVSQSSEHFKVQTNETISKVIDTLSENALFMVSQDSEEMIREQLTQGQVHAAVIVDDTGGLTVMSTSTTQTISELIESLLASDFVKPDELKVDIQAVSDVPNFKQEVLVAEGFSYISFLLPAILSLSLVQLCLYGTATPLVAAKERGILRYYAIVPMPKSALLAAQITVRYCLAVIQIVLLLLLTYLFLGMSVKGSFFALVGFLSLSAVMLITAGYALGGLFKSLTTATAVIMLLNFYLMTFGQIFIDFENIPVAKYLVLTTPVGFVSDATRQIMLDSSGMFPMYVNVLGVLGWFLFLAIIAVKYFKFLPKSE